MTPDERLYNTILQALDSTLANVHTATIGKIVKVNEKTVDIKPVFNRVVQGRSIELPVFTEVPPMFLYGGGNYDAFPVAIGDYALLVFCERCTDGWFAGSDFIAPLELRMHDYSDGFALVGLKPAASLIPIPSERTMVGNIRMGTTAPVDFMALANKVKSELDSIKTDLDNLKTWADGHTHTGVTVGLSSSGAPGAAAPTPHTPASVASGYIKAD